MSMEAPKPQRDLEFYDEDGRVKDPEIARTMAHTENHFYEDKKSALKRASEKGIFAKPLEEMKVEKEFNERRLKLDEWMETSAKEIKDRDQNTDKWTKEEQQRREMLRSAPSLLSPEEKIRLWERFDKLINIKISDGFREKFETGVGKNLEVTGKECSLEDLITFLESFDRIFMATDKMDRKDGPFMFYPQVKHLNGKSYENVYCEYDRDLDKLNLGVF